MPLLRFAERGIAQRGSMPCGKRKDRERKKKKERERKYGCLINEEGIGNVNFQEILFILLSFLLKWRG
jgi:hypothetical protein